MPTIGRNPAECRKARRPDFVTTSMAPASLAIRPSSTATVSAPGRSLRASTSAAEPRVEAMRLEQRTPESPTRHIEILKAHLRLAATHNQGSADPRSFTEAGPTCWRWADGGGGMLRTDANCQLESMLRRPCELNGNHPLGLETLLPIDRRLHLFRQPPDPRQLAMRPSPAAPQS